MPLEDIPVHEITEDHLQKLVGEEKERKTIEFKRDQVGRSEGDKKEFLADVSSFANAAGGHLIFGMAAEGGLATELVGISIDGDKELLRLEEMIRDGIRPRIMGLASEAVPLSNGSVAIVIRVPKSWNPPHQVVFQKTYRFWGRGSNGKHPFDVDELRSIFSVSETMAERIRDFRVSRVAGIEAGETPVRLSDNRRAILHLVPFSAFSPAAAIDISPILEQPSTVMPTQWSRLDCRHNLEGFLVFQEGEPPAEWYAQVYRTGIVEFVASNFVSGNNGFRWIPGNGFEELILDYVTRVLSTLLRCGVSPPVVILLTLIHVEGVHLSIEREIHGRDTREPFDRSIISIPELVLETVEGDISKGMKPLFDALWNASGWPKSPCYDAAGNRIRNSVH